MRRKSFLISKQQGFSLVEILVAVVIIAIGLLGIASLQASAVSSTTTANMRSMAGTATQSLTASMRANKAFWRYDLGSRGSVTTTINVGQVNGESVITVFGKPAGVVDCSISTSAPCSPDNLAIYQISQWYNGPAQSLFMPELTIEYKPGLAEGTLGMIEIVLSWQEKLAGELVTQPTSSAFRTYEHHVFVRI